jgi:hypothetical protein
MSLVKTTRRGGASYRTRSFTEDAVFYDPSKSVHRGRDEIDRIAGAIGATHLDFRYQPIAEPEELGNGGPMGIGPPWRSASLRRD